MNRCWATCWCLAALAGPAGAADRPMPTEFVADRIFLVAQPPTGAAVRFFTDTGGGWNAISRSAATRLTLPEESSVQLGATADTIRPLVGFPYLLLTAGIPRPGNDPFYRGGLVVIPDVALTEDGVLGSRWFADHVWEIDYDKHTLKLLDAAPADAAHRVPLGFKGGQDGQRALDFPRVMVTVDGEPIEMLLDTGATLTTTAASAKAFKVAIGTRIATSFVSKSTFDRWTGKHRDWRVVDAADSAGQTTFPMIEVPRISIGGVASGPVWFTQRPDTALHDFMSSMTDQVVDGALGGSGLRYYRVTLDYPAAAAWFERFKTSR